LIQATGWLWEYIDENMTLPRLEEMTKYWDTFPPIHISVARIYSSLTGYKPPSLGVVKREPEKGINEFITEFMAQGGILEQKNG
jgi:hypothetical protein